MAGYVEEQDFQGLQTPMICTKYVDHGVNVEEEAEDEQLGEEISDYDIFGSDQNIEPVPLFIPGHHNFKTRLRWTHHLHASFVSAVNQLGGPQRATPKTIMQIMGVKGITLFHLKSHLQKYRNGKFVVKEWRDRTGYRTVPQVSEEEEDSKNTHSLSLLQPHENEICKLNEDLKTKKEDQDNLCLQIEAEKHLELRQNAERRYLSLALDNASKKLAHQILGDLAVDWSSVHTPNVGGLEELVGYPAYHITEAMQLSFAPQLGRSHSPMEARQSGHSSVEAYDEHTDPQLGRFQPKTETHFAAAPEINMISDVKKEFGY